VIKERQEKQIKLRAEFGSKKDSLHKPSPAQREQMKKVKAEDKKAFEEQLKKILTPTQFETWNQLKTDQKNKRKDRMEKRTRGEN
jgi:hypothetical protein